MNERACAGLACLTNWGCGAMVKWQSARGGLITQRFGKGYGKLHGKLTRVETLSTLNPAAGRFGLAARLLQKHFAGRQ